MLPEGLKDATGDKLKLVYTYLKSVSSATIHEISEALGISKLELHPTLSILADKGYAQITDCPRGKLVEVV